MPSAPAEPDQLLPTAGNRDPRFWVAQLKGFGRASARIMAA
jgi:hypothetical protein